MLVVTKEKIERGEWIRHRQVGGSKREREIVNIIMIAMVPRGEVHFVPIWGKDANVTVVM